LPAASGLCRRRCALDPGQQPLGLAIGTAGGMAPDDLGRGLERSTGPSG
jgi:hypothetical protein